MGREQPTSVIAVVPSRREVTGWIIQARGRAWRPRIGGLAASLTNVMAHISWTAWSAISPGCRLHPSRSRRP
jgi:hypothetical protein